MMDRNGRICELFRSGEKWNLSRAEYAALLPPRNPTGCWQKKVRGVVIKELNRRGFTVEGTRCR